MQYIFSLIIFGLTGLGAYWFLERSEERRLAKDAQRRQEEAARNAALYGYAPDDPPIWDPSRGEDDLVRKILDEGDADNSKHVDAVFRKAFRERVGMGLEAAFLYAMDRACWRRGSRNQVYDRLLSNRQITESRKDQLRAASAHIEDGWGPIPGCGDNR